MEANCSVDKQGEEEEEQGNHKTDPACARVVPANVDQIHQKYASPKRRLNGVHDQEGRWGKVIAQEH